MSAIVLAHNHVLDSKTKHMELGLFFVREKVLQKHVSVVHILGMSQLADLMTKALAPTRAIGYYNLCIMTIQHSMKNSLEAFHILSVLSQTQ
jgi:hypothetical protein